MGNQPTTAVNRPKSVTRRLLAYLCVLAALAYIANTVWSHAEELRTAMQHISVVGAVAMCLMATLSIAVTTCYHALLLNQYSKQPIRLSHGGAAYAIGQIVRYLPGKIWGVVFEADYLRGLVNVRTVSIALLIQTILGYFWASTLACVILLAAYGSSCFVYLLLVPAAWLLWAAHRRNWVYRLFSAAPVLRRYFDREAAAPLDRAVSAKLCLLLILNWLPFLAGWVFLLYGTYSIEQSISFGAAYIVASIASTALIVVPSGIVVREAMFTALGAAVGFPATDLLLYGLVIRIALTLADAMNAAIYAVSDRMSRSTDGARAV